MTDSIGPCNPSRPSSRSAVRLTSVGVERLIVVTAVVVLPVAYLIGQALFDPEIEFLPPSFAGDWIFHPVQKVLSSERGHVSQDVEFALDFVAPSTEPLVLRLRAFRSAQVLLNGHEIPALHAARNWKRSATYDLPPLVRSGTNHLRIRVHNDTAIPGLLVQSPRELRTPGHWTASLASEFDRFERVVGPRAALRPSPLHTWGGQRWVRLLTVGWLIVAIALTTVAFARSFRMPQPISPRARPSRLARVIVPLVILGTSGWFNARNTSYYSFRRTDFDWQGHVEYVQRMARTWTPPLATDGWEMFQPPLYYATAAGVYRWHGGDRDSGRALKSVQYLGCAMGLGLVLLTWRSAGQLFPATAGGAHWAVLAFAAFLPVVLTMSPLVSNEMFAATMIAAATYVLVCWLSHEQLSLPRVMFLGLLTGLALLCKFTALFLFGAAVLALVVRACAANSRRSWAAPLVYVAVVLLVCGWYYGRNVALFGKPFIGNWDEATGFHHELPPTYRTAGFYGRFGCVFFAHPNDAPWASWADGIYASFWGDAFGNFFTDDMDWAYSCMTLMYVVAALPSCAIALGLIQTLIALMRRPSVGPDLLLVAMTFWTCAAHLSFTMTVPIYSSVKASYFLSLVPVLGIFLARGRALLDAQLRFGRRLLDISLALLGLLAVFLYRYALVVLVYGAPGS